MTEAEALAARNKWASRDLLPEVSIQKCSLEGGGCKVDGYSAATEQRIKDGAFHLVNYAATCVPCELHAPSQLQSWMNDVPLDAIRNKAASGQPFALDDLRAYLPVNHPEATS